MPIEKKSKGLSKEETQIILADTILFNRYHQDYERVTELAELYCQLITGDKADELLERFVRRETTEMFDQRVALTVSITPCIAHRVMQTWYKVPRVEPVVNKLDFEGDRVEERKSELMSYMNKYFGNESVDSYLGRRIPDLNGTDPNAFILTLFNNFDNKKEKSKPFPIEITSEEAINFEYENNELQWLIVKLPHSYLKHGEDKVVETAGVLKKEAVMVEGFKYKIYNFNDEIIFTQIDTLDYPQAKIGVLEIIVNGADSLNIYRIDDNRLFKVDYFTPNAGMVPAFRVGVKRDLLTKGRTCVNLFHAAIPYFLKTVKTVSEMDLTMALHAFFQKITYVPRCKGTPEKQCHDGVLSDGRTKCSVCGGTGKQTITTTQDDLEMLLPKNMDQLIDLAKLVHYVDLPIDVPKFQDEYIEKLEQKVVQTLYGSDIYVASSVSKTATEKNIDMQSIYDAHWILAVGYAEARKLTVKLIATFTDLGEGLIQEYKYSKDFKFKTLTMLLDELNLASESKAPAFTVREINRDIAHIIFADRPDELRKIEVMERFDPFEGKTSEEIRFLISMDMVTEYSKTLFSEFKTIFQSLEDEQKARDKKVWFYDLAYDKQSILVKEKVLQVMAEVQQEKESAMQIQADFNTPPGN